MKISPVSGDMAIKLGLVAVGLGLAWAAWRKVSGVAGDALTAVGDSVASVADSVGTGINPANPMNIVNRTVSGIGGAVVSDTGPGKNADGSWTVGGWLYDVAHPGWQTAINSPVPPANKATSSQPAAQFDAFGNYLGNY